MHRILVFASGNGSNALNLIDYFRKEDFASVVAVFSNKQSAGVVQKAKERHIDVHCFNRHDFYESRNVIELVKGYKPDLIVLAGFLWLVPEEFINAFEGKIINLHPSLLPKFGGKGMYGRRVHEAVLEAGEKETGISIHLVNKEFDKGELIYQDKFTIFGNETVEEIESRIHELEHRGLPLAVEKFLGK